MLGFVDGGASRHGSARASSARDVAGAAGVEESGSGSGVSLFARLAMELQIAKGIAYLKQKQFERVRVRFVSRSEPIFEAK